MIKPMTGSTSIGTAFSHGLQIFKENFPLIFLGYLITVLISSVTCGICGGPLTCGLIGIVLALFRNQNPKPQVNDLFNGFQKFLPAFVAAVAFGLIITVIGWIPVIGQLAAIIVSIVSIWAFFLIQDQEASISEAIVEPLKLIGEKAFWPVMLVIFVAGLIGAVGALVCCIGAFFTMPLCFCMIVAAYEEVYSAPAQLDASPAAAPAPPTL